MPAAKKLIDQALSLPVEERALVADSLLKSLNKPDPAIDKKWIRIAKQRLEEIRSGKVKPIPGNEVFNRVDERFTKWNMFFTTIDYYEDCEPGLGYDFTIEVDPAILSCYPCSSCLKMTVFPPIYSDKQKIPGFLWGPEGGILSVPSRSILSFQRKGSG